MLRTARLIQATRCPSRCLSRGLHTERFVRASTFWISTQEIPEAEKNDSNALLVRAGFIEPTYAGIFQFLPLGLRVQEKIERLITKHMRSVGASQCSLSTLSSEEVWRKSGRLQGDRSELFSLADRKGSRFLLSPTHEEEITTLVRGRVRSYQDLPLRLFQITRKYRDEPRPRQGLLRTREFLMKDLYTFDASKDAALETYEEVRKAYAAFFEELKLPYIVADADSGSIGGDLSHEYHVASTKGEDRVHTCKECRLSFNEEIFGWNPNEDNGPCTCPKCSRSMSSQTTIELGHTFYLGTKYSAPLGATIAVEEETRNIEMGCHGIGITRLIAGVANLFSDDKGLGWSKAIAPFDLVIVPDTKAHGQAAELASSLANTSDIDTILDDRQKSLGWKLKDADAIGYPVKAILGRTWEKEGTAEIQSRRLGVKQDVDLADVPQFISSLLDKY